jgi:hypothetical protein
MGDTNISINYWVIIIYLILFLLPYLFKKNTFTFINLLIYFIYTFSYILISYYNIFNLYQMILIHFFISTIHWILAMMIQLIISKYKNNQ